MDAARQCLHRLVARVLRVLSVPYLAEMGAPSEGAAQEGAFR